MPRCELKLELAGYTVGIKTMWLLYKDTNEVLDLRINFWIFRYTAYLVDKALEDGDSRDEDSM